MNSNTEKQTLDVSKGIDVWTSDVRQLVYDDEKHYHIKTNEIFKQLREEIENGYFENLIKEYLIDK